MSKEKNVKYSEIGDVRYRKNLRAKNIAIRITRDGQVNVTVPAWCTYKRAEIFVVEKHDWIRAKLLVIKRRDEEKLVWKVGDSLQMFEGEIRFVNGVDDVVKWRNTSFGAEMALPSGYNPSNIEYRSIVKEKIAEIGLQHAKGVLPEILRECSEKHELPYNRLTVRRAKTRWGSCSGKNNISLNSALVFLDRELIDYVCYHELAHTVHKNHSKEFWNFVVAGMPDAKSRRGKLRSRDILA